MSQTCEYTAYNWVISSKVKCGQERREKPMTGNINVWDPGKQTPRPLCTEEQWGGMRSPRMSIMKRQTAPVGSQVWPQQCAWVSFSVSRTFTLCFVPSVHRQEGLPNIPPANTAHSLIFTWIQIILYINKSLISQIL